MTQQKATNVVWHEGLLTQSSRFELLGSKGATVWFTGLSAAGKSTIASALEFALVKTGVHAYRLDGDNIRHGLNKNLGFSREDRAENIRRIGEVARLFADSGAVAITAFISPYRADRDACRALHVQSNLPFIEVFVDTPLSVCEARDPKGQYRMARQGQIKGFTGIDDPYEAPEKAELVLPAGELTVDQCVLRTLETLRRYGIQS